MPIDTPPLLGGSQATQSLKAREPISSAQNTADIPGIAEERGDVMRKGMMRAKGGSECGRKRGETLLEGETPDLCHNRARLSTTICRAACAERLTSIDTKQKRRIFSPKALQDP